MNNNKMEEHPFKFKTFTERVGEVDLRKTALYYIEHENEELDSNQTQFCQAIRKWSTLNLSDEYNNFQKRVVDIITLPQLIHKKDFVINLLLESLDTATTLSLQPLLEFIVVLSKDLREEFYVYFDKFFDKLLFLLNTSNADQLEWTLICLAVLFKSLKSFLKKDISVIFNKIFPLLEDGQPVHITNFAAECFAYIARDIKDKEKFTVFVLKAIKDNENGITGCGRLFFEMMRGVNEQFHSCAEAFYTTLLQTLYNVQICRETLFQVLVQTVCEMLQFVNAKYIHPFWSISFKFLNDTLDNEKISTEQLNLNIKYVLQLVGQAIEYRDGKLVEDVKLLIQILLRILDSPHLTDENLMMISQISSIILTNQALQVTQLDATRLIKKNLHTDSKIVFEDFISNMVEYSSFDMLVLPDFVKYLESHFNDETILLLSEIIVAKSPICKTGINIEQWNRYPIVFKSEKVKQQIVKRILSFKIDDIIEKPKIFLLHVVCLQHYENLDTAKVLVFLNDFLIKLCDRVTASKETADTDEKYKSNQRLFTLLSVLVEVLINLKFEKFNPIRVIETVLLYCRNVKYLPALRILDMCLTHYNAKTQNDPSKLFHNIQFNLSENLISPYQEIRLLTSHIFSLFHQFKIRVYDDDNEAGIRTSIYDIMYKNESIEPTVATYREKIILLQRLMYESPHHRAVHDKSCELDTLKYLFSVFYVNFKLLWEPAIEIIKTYETNIPMIEFWPIVKTQIDMTIRQLNKATEEEERAILVEGITEDDWHCADKIDFINYRLLLFRTIVELTTTIQMKTRDLMGSFMSFLQIEYNTVQKSKNILLNLNELDQDVVEVDIVQPDGEVVTVNFNTAPKATHKILVLYLRIMAKVTNPRIGFCENELFQIYVNFLSHKSLEVQKLAFDCIINYKLKYVNPYKQNIYNLIDEKTFKDELLSFKIARQDQYILDEHRGQIIPLVMRILYTKMITKYGANSDKSSFLARKQMVLRFIGKCEECEIFSFTNMAFKVFLDVLRSPVNIRDCLLKVNANLPINIPANIIQSSLGLIEMVRDHFAGVLSENFHRYILHLLICMGFAIQRNPEIPDNVQKTLRSLCLNILTNFFGHFERFIWREEEIDVIFEIFVWPQLAKISDAIHTPTPLLKLFIEWSKNPRFFILLAKHQADDPSCTPLPFIIRLLQGENTSSVVTEAIMEMIEKMLTYADVEKDDSGNNVEVAQPICLRLNILPLNANAMEQMKLSQPLNYGSALLLPFIPNILSVLQQYLNRKSKVLSKRNLFILSRVTELVNDESTSSSIISLLIPICLKKVKAKKSNDTENLTQMLTTMHNLIRRLGKPANYVRQIAPFFEFIVEVNLRRLLCDILTTIYSKYDDKCKEVARIVSDLNALNRRWIEQPDYEKRIDAFKRIEQLTTTNELNIELAILFIHHCLFFSKYEKDLAINDLCTTQLRSVCNALATNDAIDKAETDYVFNKLILSSIQRNIKSNNEKSRNDCLVLLGELSRECTQVNDVFADLNALTNKANREVDFFDNITHLQMYRHTKALTKFKKLVDSGKCTIKPKTLMNFILPIADTYLCSDKYLKKANILTAATDCVGAVCSLLSWQNYLSVLRHYLGKLRRDLVYQKQLIKIVSAILDAFHFDMSLASVFKLKEIIAAKDDEENEAQVIEDAVKNLDIVEEEDDANAIPITDNENQSTSSLSEDDANRLIAEISQKIIPDLFRIINEKTSYDAALKINQQKERIAKEKEDMLRIPIAVAIVKLLQKLPSVMLDKHLPRLILKISTFLKSSMKSVRVTTRETLKTIMISLGTKHLEMVLRHLKSILLKGFQVHVLSVTYYTLIDALKGEFKTGEVDRILQLVLNVCIEDIFGATGDEKEVEEVIRSTPEANPSKKSFLAINILACNITETCILDLILPFKNILLQTNSKKKVQKVQECLQKINAGLTVNTNLSMESLLYFIYGTTSESIPDLIPEAQKKDSKMAIKQRAGERPDIFIIPQEPTRRGAIRQNSKINSQANSHVLVEFGLELLDIILKRQKLMDMEYESYLQPMVKILINSLDSIHVRVASYSIKCLTSIWSSKMEIGEIKDNMEEIVKSIFVVLHKYATLGISRNNDNFTLVKNSFKCVVTLLRYVKYYTVSTDQLKILLLYVEQDIHNTEKQTMAFTLLKSIIARKLSSPKIHEIMQTLSEIIVTSSSTVAQNESRTILLMYMLEYPLGRKLESFIKFFIKQLEYDVIMGRQSVITMFSLILHKFPIGVVEKYSDLLFLSFGARLVNDEEPECKIMIAECLETIISRMNKTIRDQLFDLVKVYLEDKQLVHREMAAQLCIRFVVVEKEEFSRRFKTFLPDLLSALQNFNTNGPGKFVRAPDIEANSDDEDADQDDDDEENANSENEMSEEENMDLSTDSIDPKLTKLMQKQKQKDHCLIQLLNIHIKILEECPDFLTDDRHDHHIDEISYICQTFLAYEHAWVRLLAAKILDKVLSSMNFDELQERLLNDSVNSSGRQFLFNDPMRELKSLALDLCAQLQPNETDEELATQVITNLLYIANVIKAIPIESENEQNSKQFNLLWLIRRMRYVVHAEITKAGSSIILRKNVYKWLEATTALLDAEQVLKLAPSLLSPVIREMGEGEHINETLKEIAVNIGNQLKSLIGDEKYNKIRLELQSRLANNRMQRKQNIAREKVRNPIIAAKRKFAIQFKKKEARKRKQSDIRDGLLPKKKKKRMEDLFR